MTGAMATGIMKRMGAKEKFSGIVIFGRLSQEASAMGLRSTSKKMRSAI